MIRFAAWGAAMSVLLAVAIAPPASAQIDDELLIDPDSPSGIEYDIPLERARRNADPGRRPGSHVARGGQSSPAFGEGIAPRRDDAVAVSAGGAGGAAGAGSAGGAGADGRESGRRARERRSTPLPPEVVAAASRPAAPSGGAGAVLLYGTIGLVVVALGAGIGLLLRRRSAG